MSESEMMGCWTPEMKGVHEVLVLVFVLWQQNATEACYIYMYIHERKESKKCPTKNNLQ